VSTPWSTPPTVRATPPEEATESAATPATAASLLPRHTALQELPATWGWRGRVHRLSKGAVAPKPTAAEVRHRQATVAVRRSYTRPMTVMFANPKGGAGKTPATLLAGATFGQARGGYVVAWDNNETRGTLGVRGLMPDQDLTVWDLLGHLDRFERIDARAGDLAGYVRAQGEARFDVLASDESAENMSQIGVDEFERLRTVLSRFYKLILVDTGNNIRASNWQAAADAADLLVVCSSYRRDVAFSAAWMLDHLERTGRADLAKRAVTVLSASEPQVPQQARAEIIEHFTGRTRTVVEIPYDRSIAPGERIDFATVDQATRDAWLYACAAIADGLAEADHTRR
jgi:MinD-like ATPase involved in chromosome partitioning or flagellar assembly